MEVLLFGGTTEGRLLVEFLAEEGCPTTLCVATDYGRALVPAWPGLRVLAGRLDAGAILELLRVRPYTCAVDATHPYAAQVSQNLRAACTQAGLPCYRLAREEEPVGTDWRRVTDVAGAAAALCALPGAVLLTTGSKELAAFALPGLVERCVPRVLPGLDSLSHCLELGFLPAQIICMQGPFTQALNEATIGQYQIKTVVTKASGAAGGFWEKAEAARSCGCALVVIGRPNLESGLNLAEMKSLLKELLL